MVVLVKADIERNKTENVVHGFALRNVFGLERCPN